MVAGALQLLGVPMGSVDERHEDPIFHDEGNVGRMIETIEERNDTNECWGWKLPNTIYYYQKLAPFLRNPVFIVVYRNPFDIFNSAASKAMDGLTDAHFNAPVYHYAKMHQIIHDAATVPAFLMSYEAVCASPGQFVAELSKVLSVRPSSGAMARCRWFVDAARGYTDIKTATWSVKSLIYRLFSR